MNKTKKELEEMVHDDELLERGKTMFSAKWVERLLFWVLVTVASGILGFIVNNYLSSLPMK